MEEKKTKRQELEERLSEVGLSLSIIADGENNTKAILSRDKKEVLSIRENSEEAACEKVAELFNDAMMCYKLKRIFGDALAGVIIIK